LMKTPTPGVLYLSCKALLPPAPPDPRVAAAFVLLRPATDRCIVFDHDFELGHIRYCCTDRGRLSINQPALRTPLPFPQTHSTSVHRPSGGRPGQPIALKRTPAPPVDGANSRPVFREQSSPHQACSSTCTAPCHALARVLFHPLGLHA